MPPVRYYEVVETRVVKVRANEAIEAAKVGTAALSGELARGSTDAKKVTDPVRVIELRTNEIGRR